MKCNKAEKIILSEGSVGGENYALLAHLEACSSCNALKESLISAHSAFNPNEAPSEVLIQNIKREARLRAPERKKAHFILLRPALATAASILVILALFMTVPGTGRVGLELDVTEAQLLDSDGQVVHVQYSGLSEDDLAFNFLMMYDEG